MVQTQRPGRRQRIEAAIGHALERRWDLAAEANRALLEEDAGDVEAANRLGKALTELDDIKGALSAYETALTIDPTNAIARKNRARLEEQRAAKRPARSGARGKAAAGAATARGAGSESLRTSSVIEEFGKSAELALQRVNAEVAGELSSGDPAELVATQSGVAVHTANGAALGQIDPRIGLRLRRMMEGGNRYAVVVRRAEGGEVLVHVRESFKHPSLASQASFLPQAGDPRRKRAAPRAYTKSSVLQYGRGEDDEDYDDEDEGDVWRARSAADDDLVEDDEEVGELGHGDAGFDADDDVDEELDED